jgi:hypothetical protein
MNRIQTIVEMIKVKSGMFGEREHVIAEYDSLVKYVGTLNMEVGAGAMSAFEHEIKNHITGKRIYDVLNGLLRSQDLLAKVIEENIDLDEVQRAIPACSGTVVGEPCGNRLTRDYVESVPFRKDLEKKKVREFFRFWATDSRNSAERVREEYSQLVARGRGRFTSRVLPGGLFPRRDITDEVIAELDGRYMDFMYSQGSGDANASIDKKIVWQLTYMKYFRTIWEIEDNCGYAGYLEGRPLKKVVTNKTGPDAEEELSGQELEIRIKEAEGMVEERWTERMDMVHFIREHQEEHAKLGPRENMASNVVLMNEVVFGLRRVLAAIIEKVSKSLMNNKKVRDVVNGSDQDPRSGRSVGFSLDKGDVSAVMAILRKHYREPPVTMVFSSLRDLFTNEEECTPQQLKLWLGSRMLLWGEYELFEHFTMDILFTFVAVQKLKNSELARRAYQAVMDAMAARPQDYTKEALKTRRGMMDIKRS